MAIPKSITIEPSILYFGTPVALISTLNPDGTTNLSPMSSAWALGNRVVLGLSTQGQSFTNLQNHTGLVINLPSGKLWEHIERIAPTTGVQDVPDYKQAQGYTFEGHKFERSGLTSAASETVKPLRVADCPLQLEATLLTQHAMTSVKEDGAMNLTIIETRVQKVHAHASIVIAGTNHVDSLKWQPLLYVFRHYFSTGERLAINFKDEVSGNN